MTEIKYESTVKNGRSTTYTTFRKPGENEDITEPYKVTSNYYSYYPYSLTTSSSTKGDCKGISTSSNAYNAIFLKSDGTSRDYYWLGTSYASTDVSCVFFGIRSVYDGVVYHCNLWYSYSGDDSRSRGVRAAVSLRSDIKLKPNGANSWKISK